MSTRGVFVIDPLGSDLEDDENGRAMEAACHLVSDFEILVDEVYAGERERERERDRALTCAHCVVPER